MYRYWGVFYGTIYIYVGTLYVPIHDVPTREIRGGGQNDRSLWGHEWTKGKRSKSHLTLLIHLINPYFRAEITSYLKKTLILNFVGYKRRINAVILFHLQT